jgi:hypothetical protein
MIKKLSAIAVVGILTTAGLIVTGPTASSAPLEEGPCIIAVWKDDPSITAQRGDCSAEAEMPERPVGFLMENNIHVVDTRTIPTFYHVRVVNERSGAVVVDQDYSAGHMAALSDYVQVPVADADTDRPTYLVTLTVDGIDYSYSLTPDQYAVVDGEWTIHVDTFLEDGVFRHQTPPWFVY